jgi:hypothetical protein
LANKKLNKQYEDAGNILEIVARKVSEISDVKTFEN